MGWYEFMRNRRIRFNTSQNAYRSKGEGLECFPVQIGRMSLNDFLWKVVKNHSPACKLGINFGLIAY